jgi:hypothetical protein
MIQVGEIKNRLRAATAPWDNFRHQALPLFAALLAPTALMAATLGLWRLGSDMSWTGEFPIENGIFSHWQVWMSLGVLTEIAAYHLNRRRKNQ